MSVKITYVYSCDICNQQVRPDDHYEIMPYWPAMKMAWPVPSVEGQGCANLMLCSQCMELAREPLIKRFQEINPIKTE